MYNIAGDEGRKISTGVGMCVCSWRQGKQNSGEKGGETEHLVSQDEIVAGAN